MYYSCFGFWGNFIRDLKQSKTLRTIKKWTYCMKGYIKFVRFDPKCYLHGVHEMRIIHRREFDLEAGVDNGLQLEHICNLLERRAVVDHVVQDAPKGPHITLHTNLQDENSTTVYAYFLPKSRILQFSLLILLLAFGKWHLSQQFSIPALTQCMKRVNE